MAEARPAATWDRRGWILLLVLSGNMILDAIEGSLLVPAFGTLTTALGRSVAETQWLLSGFAAGFAALLLAGPTLAARFGRRRVYLAAMAVFAVASLIGGLTDDLTLLVLTRIVKGAAAALTAPAGLAVIAAEFAPGAQQRRAIAVYAAFGAAGFTTGLLLSGWFAAVNWHLLFVFPAPIALLLLVAAWRVVPDPPVTAPPRLSKPLARNGSLVRSTLGAGALNGGYLALLVLIAVQLHALGWAPWQIALGLLPASLPLAVSIPFAGRFVARYGTARLILAGAVATLAGHLLLFARPEIDDYVADALPVLLLIEAGFVLSFAALNMQSTATVPPELRAIAVPLYQTGVQCGAALVLPITVATAVAFDAYRPAAAVIALVGLLGVAAAAVELRTSTRQEPAKTLP